MPPAGGRVKGGILFRKREYPLWNPKRKAFIASEQLEELQCLPIALPARGVAAFGVAIRFAAASIIRCRSAHLVGVRSNFRLPPVPSMRRAQQCRYFARSLPPRKRHSRLTTVRRGCCQITTRRDSWRSHVHRTHTAQRVQFFKLQTANVRGQGAGPLAFSWGSKGDILSRERISPLSAAPHGVGKSRSLFGLLSPSAPCAEKERTSLSRSPLLLLIFCCAEAIIPLPASPSQQRQPSPVRRRNTARSARSASRTSRGTGSWSAGQWRSSSALPRGTRPR